MFALILSGLAAAGLSFVQSGLDRLRVNMEDFLPDEGAYGATALLPSIGASVASIPYDHSALEPDISQDTLRHHRDVHEAQCVTSLMQTLSGVKINAAKDPALWARLASEANAVLLHQLYWESLSPEQSRGPRGVLRERLRADFGSPEAFEAALLSLASSQDQPGWIVLAWSSSLGQLVLVPIEGHSGGLLLGMVPLLVIDLWEHAWYLDRASDKGAYLDAILRRLSWDAAGRRLSAVSAEA